MPVMHDSMSIDALLVAKPLRGKTELKLFSRYVLGYRQCSLIPSTDSAQT
jgi:hypothetical protein